MFRADIVPVARDGQRLVTREPTAFADLGQRRQGPAKVIISILVHLNCNMKDVRTPERVETEPGEYLVGLHSK